jgi:hypothetical protein
VQFSFEAIPSRLYDVQASTNLVEWTTVTNFTGISGAIQFTDDQMKNFSHRFYRVVQR